MTLEAVVAIAWFRGMTESGHIPDDQLKPKTQMTDDVVPRRTVGTGAMRQNDRGRIGRSVFLNVQSSSIRPLEKHNRIGLERVRLVRSSGMKQEDDPSSGDGP
jgi:hypothetical protein